MKQKDINDLTESLIKKMKLRSTVIGKLNKNQMNMSFFKSGAIEFDFGKDVPPSVRKAAMDWAKKRGLKTVEHSLNKSSSASDKVLFGNSRQDSEIVATYSWDFNQ